MANKEPKTKKITVDTIVKFSILGLIVVIIGTMVFSTLASKKTEDYSTMGAIIEAVPGMTNKQELRDNSVSVSAKVLSPELIQKRIRVSGDIQSETQTSVYPETSGKITRIVRDTGDSVKKGDIIAYVDPSRPGQAFAESPVIAPISGTIITMNISLGDTITVNTEIAQVGSLKALEIIVFVAEKYANYLKIGLPAFIELSGAPDAIFEAKISKVSPVVNKKNRTIETTLIFNTYDSRIKPGMYASIDLVVKESKDTLVVPKTAIKPYGEDNTIFIVEDGKAKRVVIERGLENDTDVEIINGLNIGDTVITLGTPSEGSTVKVVSQN